MPSLGYSIKVDPEPLTTAGTEGGHISFVINRCDEYDLVKQGYLIKTANGEMTQKEILDGYYSEGKFQDLLSADALEIQLVVAQIIMAYNREDYALINGRLEFQRNHFNYSVEFSRDLLERFIPPVVPNRKRKI